MQDIERNQYSADDGTLARSNGDGTLGGILREIGGDAVELAKGEVQLAKLELQQTLKRASIDAAGAVLGGIVLLFGLGLLCMTAVIAIEPLIQPLWARMLIMSAVYLVFGAIVSAAFIARLKRISFGVPAAAEQARRTVADVKREITHE